MNILLLAGLSILLFSLKGVSAHEKRPPKTTAAKKVAGEPPRIDGILDDEVWLSAPVYQDFVQGTPDEGQAPTETTTFQLAYDDQALYIGVMAYDREPNKIVARLARRDQRTEADWIQVTLDAHHDHQTGYVFEINAAGSLRDGFVYNDGNAYDRTWDGVWEARQAHLAKGWSVEYKIPYHVLRFSPQKAYTWGIDVVRYISRKNELLFWVLVPRRDPDWVSRFGHIEVIEGITSPKVVELLDLCG